MNRFNQEYDRYLQIINNKILEVFNNVKSDIPETLFDAMQYSVVDGGKRVRPVLMLAIAEQLGLSIEEVIDFAVALELIHSYSLVHDDLPAMDNDDYRRGKLSTHKKFGEATGILVGDALLNLAMEVCLAKKFWTSYDKEAVSLLFRFSGSSGMIKGQFLDLYGKSDNSEQLLTSIHNNKTAKLLIVSFIIPSIIAGHKYYQDLYNLGECVGLMFQIKDDILDVEGNIETLGKTPNKDVESGKLTFVSQFGIDKAKEQLKHYYNKSKEILYRIGINDFMLGFLDFMFERTK